MEIWEDLRLVLAELQDTGVLTSYPDPRRDRTDQPPFRVRLACWATDAAADLHSRFGDGLNLVVGALGYPDPSASRVPQIKSKPALDPTEALVALDGPGVVRSGDVLHTGMMIANTSDHGLAINTNGRLTALVLDSQTGHVVGGYSGAQILPLMRFEVLPGAQATIPLLVGTSSFRPELGYRVPAGNWEMAADLHLGDGRVVRSNSIPLTVTAR